MLNGSDTSLTETLHNYRKPLSTDIASTTKFSYTFDKIVGSLLILGVLFGLLGNGSAALYFWRRKTKTIHDLLYFTITAIDFMTVTLSFPIIASLMNGRYEVLFGNKVFCTIWAVSSDFSTKVSIFLATIICVTRTIAMKCPGHAISRNRVIAAILGYAAVLLTIDIIYFSFKWEHTDYSSYSCMCSRRFGAEEPAFAKYFAMTCLVLELTLPSVVTFVCFLWSSWFLVSRRTFGRKDEQKFRRISVTITIFTVVFLFCNIPCFLYQILSFLSYYNFSAVMKIFTNRHVMHYGLLMMQFFPIFLNAIINPMIYLLRIRGYQSWTLRNLKLSTIKYTLSPVNEQQRDA